MMPVMCVVRISALEILVITAFCRPMMKHSSITVTDTNRPSTVDSRAPRKPKQMSKKASNKSGTANSLCSRLRREKLTMTAEHAAPTRKDNKAPVPLSTRS
ncbi:hypothetical protein D3C81_1599210 [compost metagenome]